MQKETSDKLAYRAPAETVKSGTEIQKAAQNLPSEFILTAPPRGSFAQEQQLYQPIAEHLSKVTGKKVVYKWSENWLSYSKEMTQGQFDLVFDGPAFNGWRTERLGHTPLVKLPEAFQFAVIIKAGNTKIKELKNLAGRQVCAHAAPNLGTLTLLSEFSNPARQPYIFLVKGWDASYQGLMQDKCEATVLPVKNLAKYDGGETKKTRVLFTSQIMPNQALSAGPRVPTAMQVQIRQALLTPEGKAAAAKLLDAYASNSLVPANKEEYVGLGAYLQGNLYYRQ
jgi:ABC-type phosphate/phosphonate transport system substrate-binding protein